VPRGLARFHRARKLDCAAEEQQFFGERGLARVRVGNDGEGAAAGDVAQEIGGRRRHGSEGLKKERYDTPKSGGSPVVCNKVENKNRPKAVFVL
jgi:hypothetical protein